MAELKRASCTRCGYRSGLIKFGSARKEKYSGWPALDRSSNQVVEVNLLSTAPVRSYALYYHHAEASRKFGWVARQLFNKHDEPFRHKCPRCGHFELEFHLEALAD